MDTKRILKYSRRRCRSVAIASVRFRIFFLGSQSGDHTYEDVENMAIIRGKI
jgi:hypothetical protein